MLFTKLDRADKLSCAITDEEIARDPGRDSSLAKAPGAEDHSGISILETTSGTFSLPYSISHSRCWKARHDHEGLMIHSLVGLLFAMKKMETACSL